tara:strand:- start:1000 stop:1371 length:372 start_codon:yes stop_codon:yes gene_type:complete
MALVNKVELQVKGTLDTSIRYQIVTYCFFEKILISNSDLNFLSALSKKNDIELTKFCVELVEKEIFKSPQSARNAVTKAEKKGLLIKNGKNKKTISINKKMNIQTNGIVLLDYKVLGSEPKES